MEHLVIKPILSCTARCPTCTSRTSLHKNVRIDRQLSFEEWKIVLAEARDLGAWIFTISGGEPTLYKRLPDLVRIGSSYGWLVKINSNGSLINEDYAKKLLDAGLCMIDISLYSSIPHVHDDLRKTKGLWQKATSAIKIFARLKCQYPGFNVMSQTILCHENFTEFADLLRLHYELGSSGILVSYLEGDYEKTHLFKKSDIHFFKEEVLPRAINFCNELPPYIRNVTIDKVKKIFSEEILDASEWADGTYRSKSCKIPQKQALILANGDVHPCNIVEYVHEPVMGNLFQNSLSEIWKSKKWDNYRHELHEMCDLCPMNHHIYIPLRQNNNKLAALAKSWMQKIYLNRLETLSHSMIWKSKVKLSGLFRKN